GHDEASLEERPGCLHPSPEQRPLVESDRFQHERGAWKNDEEQPHEPIEGIDRLKPPEQDLRGKMIAQDVRQPEASREQQPVLQLADLRSDLSVAAKHLTKLKGCARAGPARPPPIGNEARPRRSIPPCGRTWQLPVRAGNRNSMKHRPSAEALRGSRGRESSR